MKHYFSINLSLVLLLFSFNLSSQEWTGAANSDWNNPLNWTDWPLSGKDITIDPVNYTGAGASPVISSASVFSPAGVLIQNGAQLLINNNLITTGRVEVLGALSSVTFNEGVLSAAGSGSSGRFIVSEGAMLTMNDGTLNCSQRLLVELGAHFILNDGIVSVGETLAIVDGDAVSSSSFIMNGGSVMVAIELAFENESGDYDPVFNMNNGTLTVNGDVVWLGVAPGTGTPRLILRGGNTSIYGSLLNDPASTANLYFQVSDSAMVNFNGPSIDLILPGDSLVQLNNGSLKFNNTSVINNNGVFYVSSANTIFNGSTTLQGNGSYVFHIISIESGHALNHANPLSIELKGDFINNGTFAANQNLLRLNGSAQQNISGINQLLMHGLQVNNPAGISLSNNVRVKGSLELLNGQVYTSDAYMISISDNATVLNASDSSFINGPMKKTGNDPFIFPVGKSNQLHRLEISAPSATNAEFIAEYFNSPFINTTSVNAPLVSVSQVEYWNLQQVTGTDPVQIKLFWEDASQSIASGCSDLTIATWNAAAWDSISSQMNGSCIGTGSGYVQSVMPVTSGFFTFGNTSISTSLNSSESGLSYILFPNPAKSGGVISVVSDSLKNEDIYLHITQPSGKVILERNFSNVQSRLDIELPAVDAGIYFLSIQSSDKKTISKLIIH